MGPDSVSRSGRLEVSRRVQLSVLTAVLLIILGVVPAIAEDCVCLPCHGTLEEVHGNYSHSAAPGSGPVAIFADNDHDEAGWVGTRPFFAITADCTICHHTDLPAVHGNDCATCHPQPYDTLGTWGGGCQQGGCHSFYHEDVTVAHEPFSNSYDYEGNDCNICHDQSFVVRQENCLNCHAKYVPGDVTPPVTTSNAQAEYLGPANIKFSITDNGKVGLGRTFYRLDGALPVPAGNSLLVTEAGSHQLDFWSKDQSGNTEPAPNSVFFSIAADTTPPTTTSNAKASYIQGATITLTATDDGSMGVKATYYRLNNGAIQSGTRVVVPATSGTLTYTLTFWSEDWSGNVESQKAVNFTVTSGGGILRMTWGDSDLNGGPCASDPEANAYWTVRSGSWGGPVVASGSDGCPNWSGFNDVAAPITTTPYFIIVEWWDSTGGYYDETWFGNIYVSTPGEVIRLVY